MVYTLIVLKKQVNLVNIPRLDMSDVEYLDSYYNKNGNIKTPKCTIFKYELKGYRKFTANSIIFFFKAIFPKSYKTLTENTDHTTVFKAT